MTLPLKQQNRPSNMWERSAGDYSELIGSPAWDSLHLREKGLIPNLLEMIGDCREAAVLDAGTGTGWLFDQINPAQAFACDIVPPENLSKDIDFQIQNLQGLTYEGEMFDIVVASLVLIYCDDIGAASRELYRVAKLGGSRLIVSLVHPYFYRTGKVNANDEFLITKDLSKPFRLQLKIADKVGPVEYFYRPLPDYVNAFVQAGWQIIEMRDWFIDMDSYRELSGAEVKTNIKRSGRVPLFTFIQCRKT